MNKAAPGSTFSFRAVSEDAGNRLDLFLVDRLPSVSRSRLADLIRQGLITVDRQNRKPGHRIRPGELVSGHIPPTAPAALTPEPIPLDILHEDEDLAVIIKPAGLVVHPAPGHESGTLVNALLYHMPDIGDIGGEQRPGIVHRLDKDTSGLLVVAKNGPSLAALADQFRFRTIHKKYITLVHGIPVSDHGEIDLPIGRHTVDRKRMAVQAPNARTAHTRWRISRRFAECALLDIDLLTGRTHQIRVHCKAMGHPVVGDALYGKSPRPNLPDKQGHQEAIKAQQRHILSTARRQLLHAAYLCFVHPGTGKEMEFSAPIPADFQDVLDRLTALSTMQEAELAGEMPVPPDHGHTG